MAEYVQRQIRSSAFRHVPIREKFKIVCTEWVLKANSLPCAYFYFIPQIPLLNLHDSRRKESRLYYGKEDKSPIAYGKNTFCLSAFLSLLVYVLLPLQTTLHRHASHTTFYWRRMFLNLFCRIAIILVSGLQKCIKKQLSHNPLRQWSWICPLLFLKLLILASHLLYRQWRYLNAFRL